MTPKTRIAIIAAVAFISGGCVAYASNSSVTQGNPFMIELEAMPASATLDGKTLPVFTYQGKPTVLLGVDLKKTPGTYPLLITKKDGSKETREITVLPRDTYEAPLGIPEKLGGNTTSSAQTLVSSLSKENAILANLRTGTKAFWTKPFVSPIQKPIVTDPYGYTRDTVGYQIAHKGTDFRASIGTSVYAMNRGVVRLVRNSPVYGKEIVVDHGFGIQTLYMHLSKIQVNTGELVLPGQLIGKSGDTGYAEAPHLHISVKVQKISIDPEAFLELFKEAR
jgi:murein DD-endopeptidase MepM/ murein hydrolase activator NlpD